MSIKRRLSKLEATRSSPSHNRHVIMWDNGTPSFPNQPTTKKQAITFISERSNIVSSAKDLMLIKEGESAPTLKEYFMNEFNIEPKELNQ